MGDRESRVRLSVVDNFSNPLAKFAGGMSGAYAGVQGLKQGLQTLAGGGGGVAGAVIHTVIDATKYTIQWASEIDQLARSTGAGARETSKLAVVFGDVGIGTQTLSSALRKMTAEGLDLNFETIKKLAKEYQALPPGVERTKFAFDKFGRAGLEMAEILDRDISELEALGRAAEKSGKILGDDAVKKAEKLETSMHQLQDRMEGFKILVGGPVIDTVNKAAQAVQDEVGVYQLLAIKVQQVTGIMDDNTASVKAAEIAGLSHAEAIRQVYGEDDRATAIAILSGEATVKLGASKAYAARASAMAAAAEKNLTDRTYDLIAAQNELAAGLSGPLGQAQEAYATTTQDLSKEIEETEKQIAKLKRSQGVYVTVTKDATASQAEYQLAIFNATEAQKKFNEAAGDTAPEKLLALQVAAEKAAEKAAKLGGELGSTSGYTVDNSTKVGELSEHLVELQEKQTAATAALHEATNEMLFQAAAAAGLKDPALTELAFSMGLIDEKSYNAQKAMDALTKEFESGKLSADDYAAKTKALADAINSLQDKSVTITETTIRITQNFSEYTTGGSVSAVNDQFGGLVPAFRPTIVGERRPELLQLDRPGRIQADVTGGQGGGNTPMVTEILAALRALPLQMKLALRSV